MGRFFSALRSPGARCGVEYSAPTQVVPHVEPVEGAEASASMENINTYQLAAKPKRMDRWLDIVVEASGSEPVYFAIVVALFTWAFLGIPFGDSNTYKIIISDAQAVVNMVFDAFLMRQQFNSHDSHLFVAACLRSRSSSHQRMLRKLIASGRCERIDAARFDALQQTGSATELPKDNWLGRISTKISSFLGHIATMVLYWICIFVWIGFGPLCGWSTAWQLYINSATSALMVLMFAFLANVRERHKKYMTKCLKAIWEVDCSLEVSLRKATGDEIENTLVAIPAPERTRLQRFIDYYADLVGTLIGIAILAAMLIIWVALGPVLHFDSNWWLLIGTYAGLVGLNDGFVLLNESAVLGAFVDEQFTLVDCDDLDMLAILGVEVLEEEHVRDKSLTYRMSVKAGELLSHRYTVVVGVITIIGLIVGASAMEWSVTGQLLCNIPPSIIESFFTLALITGHNVGEEKRRVDMFNVYQRRVKLLSYLDTSDLNNATEKIPGTSEMQQVEEVREETELQEAEEKTGEMEDGNETTQQ